jgi:PqqD family protein of HPr-rel-A system
MPYAHKSPYDERWCLRTNINLRWENWGDQWWLFQGVSGETHSLNPLGAAILTHLQSKPSDLDQLCEHLSMELDFAPNENIRAQVASTLARFDELGLIQRQTSNETTA